jgi:predicted small secreted protein
MQHHKLAWLLISAAALAGCNTWHGVKQDAKEAGGAVTNAVGTGLEKAGEGLNTAGEKVKGKDKDNNAQPQQQAPQ